MSITVGVDYKMGAPLEGENPLPLFRNRMHDNEYSAFHPSMQERHRKLVGYECAQRVLPYRMQDRYGRKRSPMCIKTIVLENDKLRAVFYPEYGGRLTSLFDKVHDRELVHNNPVFQPGNLAIRDAWLSTGIEFNCSQFGHHFLTCSPMFAARCRDKNGEEFLRMYEYERCKGVFYQMDFHLPEGADYLYMYVRIINPMDRPVSSYWWTNIDLPEREGVRVFSASDEVIYYMSPEQLSKLPENACIMAVGHLPHLDAVPDTDISYPMNYPFATDYFFQIPETEAMPWEAAAYPDGFVMYETSTKVLRYNKMFCWGISAGGKKWRDFLSDPGCGDFFEIQAGIAPTQNHGFIMQPGEIVDFVQAFGSTYVEPQSMQKKDWHEAQKELSQIINSEINSTQLDALIAQYRNQSKDDIVELINEGSGFGALELARRKAEGKCYDTMGMVFPESTIGQDQYAWLMLLGSGTFPDVDPSKVPDAYMTHEDWIPLMEAALERPENQNWNAYMNYGIMLAEQGDFVRAREAFKSSLEKKESVWAYRNLARLYALDNDSLNADIYYKKLFGMPESFKDQSFAEEYMNFLNQEGKFDEAWAFYKMLPEKLAALDRISIVAGFSAVECGELDFVETLFAREFAVIREGEQSTTELWYRWKAHKAAIENGEEYSEKLLSEIRKNCIPPEYLDFRMDAALKKE